MLKLDWNPIFSYEDDQTGGVVKVRFIVSNVTDTSKSIVDIVECNSDFTNIDYAIDLLHQRHGNGLVPMIDSDGESLADIVYMSVTPDIQTYDDWISQLEYII